MMMMMGMVIRERETVVCFLQTVMCPDDYPSKRNKRIILPCILLKDPVFGIWLENKQRLCKRQCN